MPRYRYALPLLLITILCGMASAMWLGELRMNVEVSTGDFDLKITSCKLLCEACDCECESECCAEIVDDGEGIQIAIDNAAPGSDIWVGLVLSNDGTVPLVLTDIQVSGSTFPVEIYVYGPFKSPGNSGVWGGVKIEDLPFPGDTGLPSHICEPSYKLIVWIKFVAPDSEGTTVEYSATLESTISISS